MDKIISEIIIGAVILTLLVSVIPIYRSSAQLVRSAGEKMDENENIKEVTLGRLPAAGDFSSGRYLLELLDYCAFRCKKGGCVPCAVLFVPKCRRRAERSIKPPL